MAQIHYVAKNDLELVIFLFRPPIAGIIGVHYHTVQVITDFEADGCSFGGYGTLLPGLGVFRGYVRVMGYGGGVD